MIIDQRALMTKCYNCDSWKMVSISAIPFCPDCRVPVLPGLSCECGSQADLINDSKLVPCPVCKGSGETPPFQTGFLFSSNGVSK